MQCDDRIQIAKQVGPIVWNALSSAKSGFILRYSRYHQQPATLRLTTQRSIKISHECESAPTSQYETLFLFFSFLSFVVLSVCLIVFSTFRLFVFLTFCHFVFLPFFNNRILINFFVFLSFVQTSL